MRLLSKLYALIFTLNKYVLIQNIISFPRHIDIKSTEGDLKALPACETYVWLTTLLLYHYIFALFCFPRADTRNVLQEPDQVCPTDPLNSEAKGAVVDNSPVNVVEPSAGYVNFYMLFIGTL